MSRFNSDERSYRLYGLRVRSQFMFTCASPEAQASGEAQIVFSCPAELPPASGPALFEAPFSGPDGQPYFLVFPTAHGYRMRFPTLAEFSLEGGDVRAAPLPEASAAGIETTFLSLVMALWLELRSRRGLHAAGVVYKGQALGFLANSGQGKSTLTSACLAAGASLLTDDILPVAKQDGGFIVYPGYPRLGLWPDQAAALGWSGSDSRVYGSGAKSDKLRMHVEGRFHDRPAPLAGLFVLQRSDDAALSGPRLERLSGQEALIALVRYSFLPRLSAALGLDAERLAFFGRLAAEVPVQRLVYPGGLDRLDETVRFVLDQARAD